MIELINPLNDNKLSVNIKYLMHVEAYSDDLTKVTIYNGDRAPLGYLVRPRYSEIMKMIDEDARKNLGK